MQRKNEHETKEQSMANGQLNAYMMAILVMVVLVLVMTTMITFFTHTHTLAAILLTYSFSRI